MRPNRSVALVSRAESQLCAVPGFFFGFKGGNEKSPMPFSFHIRAPMWGCTFQPKDRVAFCSRYLCVISLMVYFARWLRSSSFAADLDGMMVSQITASLSSYLVPGYETVR